MFVVYSLPDVAPMVCGCSMLGPCFTLQHFVSFLVFVIISLGKRMFRIERASIYKLKERAGCFSFVVF